jgi:hypothetical protein
VCLNKNRKLDNVQELNNRINENEAVSGMRSDRECKIFGENSPHCPLSSTNPTILDLT